MKTIGILITGHTPDRLIPDHGNYADMFAAMLGDFDFSFRYYTVVDGVFPESATEADGWMVTGSKHGVYEELDWIRRLEGFIREAHAARVPMVGICFGHQAMAKALGGTVEKFKGGWNVGTRTYTRFDTGAVQTALAFHQDQVIEPPPVAEVLGESDTCRFAVLRYGDWGLSYQPHPEFTPAFFEDLTETQSQSLPEPVYRAARKAVGPLSAGEFSAEIGAFLARPR